ncbi:MAG: hypothetical protein GWP19_02770 [Planctomycetia bacterium]|nr:hypothetical protein [Planctomycetia bacterium]
MKAVPRIHIILIIVTVLASNLFGQLSIKLINTDYQYIMVEVKQIPQDIQTTLNFK